MPLTPDSLAWLSIQLLWMTPLLPPTLHTEVSPRFNTRHYFLIHTFLGGPILHHDYKQLNTYESQIPIQTYLKITDYVPTEANWRHNQLCSWFKISAYNSSHQIYHANVYITITGINTSPTLEKRLFFTPPNIINYFNLKET